ncbi:MAG: hypothetical protein NVSMB18_30000 [Acetobacteraceae bacterium]
MAERCPICAKPATTPRLRPFCSTRCADVDLGRWFGGAYTFPGLPPELDEDPPDNEGSDRA